MNTNFFRRSLTTLTLVALSVLPMWAINFDYNGLTFEVLTANTARVIGQDGRSEYVIPERVTVDGTTYTITEIGAGASTTFGRNLQKVTIPKTVKLIAYRAFYDCLSLTEIIFNEGLEEIGSYAFYGTSQLKQIKLPSTLKVIGGYAFRNSKFSFVQLPESLTSLGYLAFNTNLKTVYNLAKTPPTFAGGSAFEDNTSVLMMVPASSLSWHL